QLKQRQSNDFRPTSFWIAFLLQEGNKRVDPFSFGRIETDRQAAMPTVSILRLRSCHRNHANDNGRTREPCNVRPRLRRTTAIRCPLVRIVIVPVRSFFPVAHFSSREPHPQEYGSEKSVRGISAAQPVPSRKLESLQGTPQVRPPSFQRSRERRTQALGFFRESAMGR